jgi:hypothetical protein
MRERSAVGIGTPIVDRLDCTGESNVTDDPLGGHRGPSEAGHYQTIERLRLYIQNIECMP